MLPALAARPSTTGSTSTRFATTSDDTGPGPCRRTESLVNAGGRARYFFDVHPIVRPWAGAGVGLYSFNRHFRDCTARADDDLAVGVPLSAGVDFTFRALTLSVSVTEHQTSVEDFQHIGMGIGWRF